MQTCTFFDFLEVLKPWIDRDYMRKCLWDPDGTFRIFLTDGGEKVYRVDECENNRLAEVFDLMAAAGVPVEKATSTGAPCGAPDQRRRSRMQRRLT